MFHLIPFNLSKKFQVHPNSNIQLIINCLLKKLIINFACLLKRFPEFDENIGELIICVVYFTHKIGLKKN